MKVSEFLENFRYVAEAPGGVQRLRELVYSLALAGTLCPQDPREGTAKVLLEDISADKEQLIRDGLFRRSPKLERAGASFRENLPEIPASWAWSRLVDICEISPRNDAESETLASFVPMSAVSEKHGVRATGETKPWGAIAKGYTHVADGDVAVAKITPCFENGKAAVFSGLENRIGAATTELHVVRPLRGVCAEFIYLFLRSPFFRELGIEQMTGTAGQKRLPREYLATRPLPLPPRAEQKRIVAKVDELMALCDKLEAQHRRRARLFPLLSDAAHTRLSESSLEGDLEAVFREIGSVDAKDLRQTLLRLGVFGKLTRQNLKVEPATRLLQRIASQRDRLLAEGYPNSTEARTQRKKQARQRVPSNLQSLPTGWAWATLMQATALVVDCHNKTAPYTNSGVRLLRTTNIRSGQINFTEPKFVSESTYERWSARCPPEPGDLLITREAPMGEVCIIPEGLRVCMGQRMMLIRPMPDFMNRKFLLYTLMEPSLLDRVQDKPIGATVKHLRVGGVETLLVPIAPREEQDRIVDTLDRLLSLVDVLEGRQKAQSLVASSFAQAAVAAITGTTSQDAKPMKPPRTELVTRLELVARAPRPGNSEPLAALLAEQDGPLSAKELWQRSGLPIETFYQQLKTEKAAGWIIEPEPARVREVRED